MSDSSMPATVRVVRGQPSPEEVAALVVVLAAVADRPAQEPARRSRWSAPAVAAGRLPRPGPGAWRAAALPR